MMRFCTAGFTRANLSGGDYPNENRNFAAMYVGSCSGCSAYLDGCTIDGTDAISALVIRGSAGEENNTVNISNTILADVTKKIRIDDDSLRLNVGVGCNITEESFEDEEKGRVKFTEEFYRMYFLNRV